MSLNVNRDVDDTFYRYKMPRLIAKVEGKGNGIKTVIVNMVDVAKALNRKAIYPTKFFGCELGAQIHVDDKNDRYIVNGSHEVGKLQELLDGYIKKFVLCKNCDNPETSMVVKKRSGLVQMKCKACGHVDQTDPIHRLTQFIIKNPPESEADGGRVTGMGKHKRTKGTTNGTSGGDSPTEGDAENDEGDEDDDEDDWAEETTEEARQRRLAELTGAAQMLAISEDLQRPESERADIFYSYVKKMLEDDEVLSNTLNIKKEAERLNLSEPVVMILMEVLLNNPATVLKDVETYKTVFMVFTRVGDNTDRAQRYTLAGMEKLVEKFAEHNLVGKACHILKKLYDCDVIQEEAILEWDNKGPSKRHVDRELSQQILENCKPMINWLKEAEEESEEEEDEEMTIPTNGVGRELNNNPREKVCSSSVKKEGEDDEVDIDAI